MNVGSISSFTGTAETSGRSQFKTIKEDFKNLQSALKAGDLKAAQDAYAKLKQDLPTSKNDGSSQRGSDLDAIGSALQSGDLAGAQKAFSTLQQDAQAARASHAHHHRPDHDGDADDVASVGTSGSSLNLQA